MIIDYLTGILVIITGIYAYLTHKMVLASEGSVQAIRDQSEAMLRPYIDVSPFVRPHTTILYLKIENSGRTGAQNVRISIDRDFFQFGESGQVDKNLKAKSAFTQTIDSVAPGGKLIFALAQGFVIFAVGANTDVTPQQFNIVVTYEFANKHVEETHRIDLRPYIGSEGERDPVVEELERLRNVVEKK